jgi:membrane dipeptidase
MPPEASRRAFLGGLAAGLALGARAAAADEWLGGAGVTVDLHSHAGGVARRKLGPLEPLAAPMREGRMAAICLAFSADQPVTHVTPDKRIEQTRQPDPGELAAWGETLFARIATLIARDAMVTIKAVADLDGCGPDRPGAIVTAEGADFLDGALSRLEDAYHRHHLRQLQLTHYRVNALGDIQTAPAVHDGLTAFGADVVRACNRLGIVVDVAHGPLALVKRAAAASTRPLVLSHTSVTPQPAARSRQISPEHARVVAETGGVIGVWPVRAIFPTRAAYAAGIARMVEAAGIDHVGIGSDMLGVPGGTVFADYRDLPALAAALRETGLQRDEVAKILGGNYQRVFAAVTTPA